MLVFRTKYEVDKFDLNQENIVCRILKPDSVDEYVQIYRR